MAMTHGRRMAVCHNNCPPLEPDQDVSARSRRLNRLRKRLEALSAGSAEVLADFCEAVDCWESYRGLRLSLSPCTIHAASEHTHLPFIAFNTSACHSNGYMTGCNHCLQSNAQRQNS